VKSYLSVITKPIKKRNTREDPSDTLVGKPERRTKCAVSSNRVSERSGRWGAFEKKVAWAASTALSQRGKIMLSKRKIKFEKW